MAERMSTPRRVKGAPGGQSLPLAIASILPVSLLARGCGARIATSAQGRPMRSRAPLATPATAQRVNGSGECETTASEFEHGGHGGHGGPNRPKPSVECQEARTDRNGARVPDPFDAGDPARAFRAGSCRTKRSRAGGAHPAAIELRQQRLAALSTHAHPHLRVFASWTRPSDNSFVDVIDRAYDIYDLSEQRCYT